MAKEDGVSFFLMKARLLLRLAKRIRKDGEALVKRLGGNAVFRGLT